MKLFLSVGQNRMESGGEDNTQLTPIVESPEEDEYEIDSPKCQDCKQEPVTCRFLHLDGREFFLCYQCYYAADHESNYGDDFEEEPETELVSVQ